MIAYANMKKRIQTKRKPPCKDKCRVAFVYVGLLYDYLGLRIKIANTSFL